MATRKPNGLLLHHIQIYYSSEGIPGLPDTILVLLKESAQGFWASSPFRLPKRSSAQSLPVLLARESPRRELRSAAAQSDALMKP